MRRKKILTGEMLKAMKEELFKEKDWVQTHELKAWFLKKTNTSIAYVGNYIVPELKARNIIQVFRSPTGLWIAKLRPENEWILEEEDMPRCEVCGMPLPQGDYKLGEKAEKCFCSEVCEKEWIKMQEEKDHEA